MSVLVANRNLNGCQLAISCFLATTFQKSHLKVSGWQQAKNDQKWVGCRCETFVSDWQPFQFTLATKKWLKTGIFGLKWLKTGIFGPVANWYENLVPDRQPT